MSEAPCGPAPVSAASPALRTDLYQVTMACGYWKSGLAEREAVFQLFFRSNPFGGGFTVAGGLQEVVHYLARWRFTPGDLHYLAGLRGSDGRALLDGGFLRYLEAMRFACDLDAVPEGTAVFPREPLLRVQGPLAQCQLLESAVLNMVNFQSLVATKAARVCLAAGGQPVLEFGLRRAQGPDGGLAASRAAYLGGCAATSNLEAGARFGIPVRGTHAHSWVMAFADEGEAFQAYAAALPNNCTLLVDTYDSLEGVRRAVETGRWLRRQGHDLAGIRLDSGDLAALSVAARRILDQAGFASTAIVASNDLDEHRIAEIKARGGAVDIWGVGTRLVTAWDDPALGGVYKLSAIRARDGRWDYPLKRSEEASKGTIPGIQQVRRYRRRGVYCADAIYDLALGITEPCRLVDPLEWGERTAIAAGQEGEDLLAPVLRRGEALGALESLEESRRRCADQLAALPAGVTRLVAPERYPVGLEERLHALREQRIGRGRGR
jgi:nicotinate phosphoribosyltransferase